MSSQKPAVSYPRFFNPERIGQSLKEVSSDLLQAEAQNIIGRWFHSADEIDLFIWTDENKKIVKQQLTLFGQVVEWNIIEGTKTGVVIEEEERVNEGGARVKASEMIRFDDRPQVQPLGLAMDVIQNTPALSFDEQQEVIGNFFRGQRFRKQDDEQFVARYGRHLTSAGTKLTLWQRFLNFLVRIF